MTDSDWYEVVKGVIRARVDRGISEASDFLDNRETYYIEIHPDPLNTNSIWFVELRTHPHAPRLIVASIVDAKEYLANEVANRIAMLLMVLGYGVQESEDQDYNISRDEMKVMREWEDFFTLHATIFVDLRYEEGVFSIVCQSGKQEIEFISLPGVSTRCAWVLTKQLTMLLASLGKYVETADHTIGNRYGLVEFAPEIGEDDADED